MSVNLNLTNGVINLSSTTIDEPTRSILAKGMNFAITPKRIPYENIISNIEATIAKNNIPTEDAETLRQDVAAILCKSRLPKSNVTSEERLALRKIRNNKDVIVLKADEGNATVILDVVDYDNKIRNILADTDTYKLARKG
ncbi:unnamed protein product [Euphydryas editha]|uniref:Uncharacterized protein n=1 Tax=Euphydryas editha TaxID=104508 RepID=A0AAU9VFK6_EUPED|nr:unnamed protein product [Euphydryas editha]CAH2109270.1 unnamed protein product [Euphydryas editha]